MSYRGNCILRVGTTSLEKLPDLLGSFSPESYEYDTRFLLGVLEVNLSREDIK